MVHRTPFILPIVYPSLTWRIPSLGQELFLTFDDGPVSGPTEFVLETLSRFGIKATFFCIGDNISKNPNLFRKLIKDDHKVGNHTFNHLNGWKTDSSQYVENIKACDTEIMAYDSTRGTPGVMPVFRPPYGRITRNQIRALHNFKIVMWDVLSIDYNTRLNSERCLKNTIGASRKGSIVVFHDSFKAEKNLTFALPRYIEHFLSLGYEFKVIPG
jgi:peptidoglycan/xylan/chitin deacetylase (PgdA/CDA1 family)